MMAFAKEGVFVGTSIWKFESWMNQLYTLARYEYRGKVVKARFERGCLAEYAVVLRRPGNRIQFPECRLSPPALKLPVF